MSADLWIEVPAAPACPTCGRGDEPERADAEMNLTYNLSPMLWAAGMPKWSEFVGMDAVEAGLIWEAVVEELRTHPDLYRTLNPPNGWGDYEVAVDALATFAVECAEAPDGAVIGAWL